MSMEVYYGPKTEAQDALAKAQYETLFKKDAPTIGEKFQSAMSKTGEVALKTLKVVGAILGSISIIPLFFQAFRDFASDTLFGTSKVASKKELANPVYQDNVQQEQKERDIAARDKIVAKEIAIEKALKENVDFDEGKFEENYKELPRLDLTNVTLDLVKKGLKEPKEKNPIYNVIDDMNNHIGIELDADDIEQNGNVQITEDVKRIVTQTKLEATEHQEETQTKLEAAEHQEETQTKLEAAGQLARATGALFSESVATHPQAWTATGVGLAGLTATAFVYNRLK